MIYLIESSDSYIIRIGKQEGGNLMSITATELKNNLSKYLLLVSKEDIYITLNGKVVAKLSNPYQDRLDAAESLFGSALAIMTLFLRPGVGRAHEKRTANAAVCDAKNFKIYV